jgi:hypothetical protein
MVPTCGLTAAKSAAIKDFLTRVTTSQDVGLEPGDLTPGDLPLTTAQLAQTRAAADAPSSKACPHAPSSPGGTTSQQHSRGSTGGHGTTGTGTRAGTTHTGTGDDTGAQGTGTTATGTGAKTHPAASSSPTAPPATGGSSAPRLAAYGVKNAVGSPDPGVNTATLLIVMLALLIIGPATFVLISTGTGPRLVHRLRVRVRR